jgi:hypothetical protein
MAENFARPPDWADDAQLTDLPALAWELLAEGVQRAASPFHTPVLGTQSQDGPELRTVVLRAAEPAERLLVCHTDLRSPKLRQLSLDAGVCWLFYDPGAKLQLRIRAIATLHQGDAMARERWAASRERSRECYRNSFAPGTPVDTPESATALLQEDGFANFAVIRTEVQSFEWLYLRAAGHRRARFEWRDGGWQGAWLAP